MPIGRVQYLHFRLGKIVTSINLTSAAQPPSSSIFVTATTVQPNAQQSATQKLAAPITPIAILTLFTGLFAVSFAPIFIRFGETELGANATVFNRLLIFALCFGTSKLITQRLISPTDRAKTISPTRQDWFLLGTIGLVSVISLVLWAIALEHTSVAKCMLLNNLTPIFTSLGSWLWLGKRFDKRFLLGLTIALAGAIFLGFEDLTGAAGFLLGDSYAIASAVFLGGYFLMVEQLRSRFSATTILLWRCILGSLLILPIVLITEAQVFPTTLTAWLAVIGLGLISEGLGQRLLADSMDKFSSSFVSLFLLLEPIVSAILAWIIFMEGLSAITWVSFGVILSGIYLAQSSQATAHS